MDIETGVIFASPALRVHRHVMKPDDWRMVTFLPVYPAQDRIPRLHRELNSPKWYRISIFDLYTGRDSGQISFLLVHSIFVLHGSHTIRSNHVDRQVSRFRNCANSDRDHIIVSNVRSERSADEGIDPSGPCVLFGSPYCGSPPSAGTYALDIHMCTGRCVCYTCAHPNNPRIIEDRG